MFENYGIRDVFHGIWRYKYILAVVIVVCTILGYFALPSLVNSETQGTYCSSVTYFVTTKNNKTQSNDPQYFSDSKEYANNLKNMLSADFCYEYVLDTLHKKHTEQEVATMTDVYPQKASVELLKNIANVTVLPDSSLVNLYITVSDQDDAIEILEAFKSYVTSDTKITPYCDITEVGGSNRHIPGDFTVSKKGGAVLAFIISAVLSLLAVFVLTLIRPTVNEIGDIEQYDIAVLGDKVSCKCTRSIDFATSCVIKAATEGTVCVLSADKKSNAVVDKLAKEFKDSADKQGADKVDFVPIGNYLGSIDSVKKAENNKAVVVVKYNYTKHTTFNDLCLTAKNNQTDILGVICLK